MSNPTPQNDDVQIWQDPATGVIVEIPLVWDLSVEPLSDRKYFPTGNSPMSKVHLTEFDKKVLQALRVCVADETIAEVDGDPGFTYCIKTQTYGEVEFIETLLGYLNEQERSELIFEWTIHLDEKTFVQAMTSQMICRSGANYMKDISVALAEKLLNHWESEVSQMLYEHNKVEAE